MDQLINFFIHKAYAVDPAITGKPLGGLRGLGLFGNFVDTLTGKSTAEAKTIVGGQLNAIISLIIGFLTSLAALWFIIKFILGGFQWLNSGGDQKQVQSAQQTMTNAVIGLAIIVAAYAIISVLGTLLGIDILHPNLMLFPESSTPPPASGGGGRSIPL